MAAEALQQAEQEADRLYLQKQTQNRERKLKVECSYDSQGPPTVMCFIPQGRTISPNSAPNLEPSVQTSESNGNYVTLKPQQWLDWIKAYPN